MNNQELELRIQEILDIENFFDMIIAAKNFEKTYKSSDFYKTTRLPLLEVLKESKLWYSLNFESLVIKLQKVIDSLDISHIHALIDQFGETLSEENADFLDAANIFKNLLDEHNLK